MRDPFGLFQQNISVSYAHVLLEIIAEYGVDPQIALKNTGLGLAVMQHPDARMSAHQWSKLVLNAINLTANNRLGIEYGSRLRLTSHGALGFAFLSCADVETSLHLCQQYFCTRIQSFIPSWQVENGFAHIYLDDVHPVKLGNAEQSQQLRCFVLESTLFGAIHFLGLFSETLAASCEVFVDWQYSSDYGQMNKSALNIHFNAPRNGLRFPAHYLSIKNPQADLIAFQQALSYCESDKDKIVIEASRDLQKSIRAELLYFGGKNYPSLPMVAKRLNMSERTIKRHLQMQGTTFLELLHEVRFAEAKRLLNQPQYSIQDIAVLVGYADTTNFIRAFKKRFARTPSQYRKQIVGE